MTTVPVGTHIYHYCRLESHKIPIISTKYKQSSLNYSKKVSCLLKNGAKTSHFRPYIFDSRSMKTTFGAPANASTSDMAVLDDTAVSDDVIFQETYPLQRIEKTSGPIMWITPPKVEGKILLRLDSGKDDENWQLTIGCNLPGKWVLHWGVNYVNDIGSEWDQPPVEMRPPDSITIKDYAIETPLTKSSTSTEADSIYEVKIDFNTKSSIATINFVLKDEETGSWYQYRGRDFKVPLVNFSNDDDDTNKLANKPFERGLSGQFSSTVFQSKDTQSEDENKNGNLKESVQQKISIESFCEEHSIVKETLVTNSMSVYMKKSSEASNHIVHIETDIPGDVIVHWGVCKDESKKWEIPSEPFPVNTSIFKNKALRTQLQQKEGGNGSFGIFPLDIETCGFVFVLKLNDNTWINCMGNDFYIPIPKENTVQKELPPVVSSEDVEVSPYSEDIIDEIRHLLSEISTEGKQKTKSKEAQEMILQEIEKLAAEAYGIFRSSVKTAPVIIEEEIEPAIRSATGSGFEILFQGFNWESNKSERWYVELEEKVDELASLGFTIVWLPPPTESISREGYMPRDLYNLNSKYGSIDELKSLVKKFHKVGIRVLGDAVINHRCAHYQNQNGIWNIYGGLLNWDDRAVVGDDPHFQGRGNKSSGDNFHAAPNIDHSQDFVRKDLCEWLRWLRKEIGYDGWRLDYVRGFWGGYVKEYMEASEPYFSVGEYWDSLSYTYGEMDHNQDAHRQRIVDWINDTHGTAGAFDVTTKGIFHSAIERCEYWRLCDSNGKPPGVVGWWPSRAVTFIENHDTGSTQGHWRFPGGKEMQGYAYILTHPGTPSVFYDHLFSRYKNEISALISLRNRNKIQCRSTVKITKAERDVYAAIINDKVAMKIGPGHYEPENGSQKWSLALQGNDYKRLYSITHAVMLIHEYVSVIDYKDNVVLEGFTTKCFHLIRARGFARNTNTKFLINKNRSKTLWGLGTIGQGTKKREKRFKDRMCVQKGATIWSTFVVNDNDLRQRKQFDEEGKYGAVMATQHI
ncbi:alpha-amylase-like 3 [Artemisia annua]|uniref:alpha-amylase n=1 Tax=Artemisia annua TaxID=35608 RepID=A0A2U1NBC5_ARTAN|nr:alpha-amylase-like 3 [Artemisia annua]